MIEFLCDNRSKDRPELLIFTKNEEIRIGWLLEYYSDLFDIVLLDGGSTDRTIELARKAGATVCLRDNGEVPIACYAHYVENFLGREKFHVQINTDEFVDKDLLFRAVSECEKKNAILLGRRLDWYYGKKRPISPSILARGAKPGQLVWNLKKLHSFVKAPLGAETMVVDIDHYHINSVVRRFGHLGYYAMIEVDGYFATKRPFWYSFKRFVLKNLSYIPIDMWRERQHGLGCVVAILGEHFADMGVGISAYAERAWLMSEAEQLETHRKRFVSSN